MNPCDDYKGLLVGLLDGELTADEARQVNDHLIRCAACRDDYEKLRETAGKLTAVSYREPSDAVLARVWKSPYSRWARNAALLLVLGGYALLLGYTGFVFFTSGREGLPVKAAITAIAIGFAVLLVQLIRERLQTYQSDPYKEIQR